MAFCPFVSKGTTNPNGAVQLVHDCNKGCAININGICAIRILAEVQTKSANPDTPQDVSKPEL